MQSKPTDAIASDPKSEHIALAMAIDLKNHEQYNAMPCPLRCILGFTQCKHSCAEKTHPAITQTSFKLFFVGDI